MRSLLKNNQGIATGMIVMIILCIVTAMIWIATMPAVGMIWDIVDPYLPAQAQATMDMLNNVCGWFLLIVVVGTLIYGAAWATHRVPIDYPA